MRNAFAETLYEEAIKNHNIYVVAADISPVGSMEKFRKEYPNRFINVGVAEQSMIGICAGLALKGKQPFAYSIANFSLYRPFEFIRNDLCYQSLPVTIVGMGAGVIYADHGATHHTMEDIAVASAIPNMQIIAPCDPEETKAATRWCAAQRNGPVYLRLGKSGEPALPSTRPWRFFYPRYLLKNKIDAPCGVILSYGSICGLALALGRQLEFDVMSVSTLKPIDKSLIEFVLRTYYNVIVIEEHVLNGGLSSWVKEIAYDLPVTSNVKCFTLKDEFIHCNGSREDLLAAHGLTYDQILAQLTK